MSTLVFLEHHEGELQKGSLGVLTKAVSLGEVAGVLVGSGVREPASPASSAGTPRSLSERVSCGFFFAPMIPLSDG